MGLDQYAYAAKFDAEVPLNDYDTDDGPDAIEIFVWRKHPNLHGWVERKWRALHGDSLPADVPFNLARYQFSLEDLDQLEEAVLGDALPHTEGFFFGSSQPEEKSRDLTFIERARKNIEQGYIVYYTSWW